MIHNVVQFGNILFMSFESFGELHFRPTFDAGAVRRCIAIVRAIQADCLANSLTTWNVGAPKNRNPLNPFSVTSGLYRRTERQ